MCKHDILIAKFDEHRKVHEHFLRLFSELFEAARGMQTLAIEVTDQYDEIQKLLRTELVSSPPPTSPKRRKARSFDSPSTVTAAVAPGSDEARGNKSESDVSALNQNIDLPDSEDSFFALTQSPVAVRQAIVTREPLSPRGLGQCSREENAQRTPPAPPKKAGWFKTELFSEKDEGGEKGSAESERKRKKGNLSLGRFNTTYKMSPETSKQVELLPVRQKLTTPKPKGTEQENCAPAAGKWTVKKTTTGNLGRMDSKTPTSGKKDNSLLNRTRLRQTKLRFQDSLNKSMADEDETYFEEFVVPSPTSVTALSGSRFLKSAKKKEQSSLVGDDEVFQTAKKKSPQKVLAAPSDEDDFDIDQTYFSEAEKDLIRSKVKIEPLTQRKVSAKAPILAPETQQQEDSNPDSNSGSSVVFVKPPSQEDIITIEETQPSKKELFMEAIRANRPKEDNSLFPSKSDIHLTHNIGKKQHPVVAERRCTDCQKQHQFLLNRGLAPDVIRAKLPRNCRECRLAQLHETPPGFWNPVFSPTQK